MGDSLFRGYRAIDEFKGRLDFLVDWMKHNKHQALRVTCSRRDYDLVRRWPKAAHAHGIENTPSGVWYRGLELVPDSGVARYGKPINPEQESL